MKQVTIQQAQLGRFERYIQNLLSHNYTARMSTPKTDTLRHAELDLSTSTLNYFVESVKKNFRNGASLDVAMRQAKSELKTFHVHYESLLLGFNNSPIPANCE